MINNEDKSRDVSKSKAITAINSLYKQYTNFTGEASKIARQLAFIEGGVFWTLYLATKINPPKILLMLFFGSLILFIIFDLAQYLYGSYLCISKSKQIKTEYILNKSFDSKLEYEIGKKAENLFIIKLVFLLCSLVLLFFMFKIFASSS